MPFKVVTPEEVQVKMALPSLEGARPVVEEAINAAQLRMEAELSTRLQFDSLVELYSCDRTINGMVKDKYYRLLLSRCFCKEGTIVVTIGGVDVTSQCILRPMRGLVFIPETIADKDDTSAVVQVAYDYGFVEGDTPPDWLREAVLSYVPAAFYMGSPDMRKDASSQEVIKQAAAHSLSVLSPHTRRINLVVYPMFVAD